MKFKKRDTVMVCNNVSEKMYYKIPELSQQFINSSNGIFQVEKYFDGYDTNWKTNFSHYYRLSNGYVYIEEVLSLYDEQRLQLLELEKVL